MNDADKHRQQGSDAGDVDRLLSELLVELKKASVPGKIDELAKKLQEQLDRDRRKAD